MKKRKQSKMYGDVLDVAKVVAVWNPFEAWGWPVSHAEVRRAITAGKLAEHADSRSKTYHARRIAYLVVHGWEDAIEVDVGCGPFGGHFEVIDGNHRLCAAILRGDASIRASTSGLVDIIKEFEYHPTAKKAS